MESRRDSLHSSANRSACEPAHLRKLVAIGNSHSLGLPDLERHTAEYWRQYRDWHDLLTRLATAVVDIGNSGFWDSVSAALDLHWSKATLPKVERLICLCLGSLHDYASIYQLALVCLLSEKLSIGLQHCFFFDPCHTAEERSTLENLGFSLLQETTESTTRIDQMSLFYIPHGDYIITENIVRWNWSSLHKVAILGNNLSWVCAPEGSANGQCGVSKNRAPNVQQVLSQIYETDLPDTFSSNIKRHFASLAPTVSQTFGDRLVPHLDCTLTTFPFSSARMCISPQSRPPQLLSSL